MEGKEGKPKFGQRVEFNARMWKRKRHRITQWTRQERPGKGLYIGKRRVFSGEVEYTDEYIAFHPKQTHYVWLVVESEHRNPIHCLPTDVVWTPTSSPLTDESYTLAYDGEPGE